jgi:hypothetical protein
VKHLLTILVISLLLSSCGNNTDGALTNSQKNNVNDNSSTNNIPAAVLESFEAKFPSALEAEWEKEGDIFEVEFVYNDEEIEAEFKSDGQWLLTEKEISISDLPESVTASISEEYPGFTIEEAEEIEHYKHGNAFEVEIENEENGIETEMELIINEDGNILNQEIENDDNDYDDDDD